MVKIVTSEFEEEEIERMAIMRGEPLVAKLAAVAKYVPLPGAMVAALVFSTPQYESPSKSDKSPKPNRIIFAKFFGFRC